MQLEMDRAGPPLSDSDILEFEERMGISLPMPYRLFLLKYNGGSPEPCDFAVPKWEYQDSLINEFNGILPGEYNDLQDHIEILEVRLPKGFIPVAADPGGNAVLLSTEGSTRGRVYFWDHENEPEDGGDDVSDYPNIYPLANSFDEFLDNLRDEDEPGTSDT